MRHSIAAIAAAVALFSLAAQAETAAPATADQKIETARKTLSSIGSAVSKDAALAPLNDAAYKARTKLEIAMKKTDPEFVKVHAEFVQAREKHKAAAGDEALRKAYYAAQDVMVADLAKRAKGNDKVKAEYSAWIQALAASEDKALELLKAKNPTKAALYEEALKTIRETR